MSSQNKETREVGSQVSDGDSSYSQILRSSVLIGGASVIAALLGAVRAKVTALLLGPAGFGLMGVFSSIVDVAVSFSAFGISSSGVREIAAKRSGVHDKDRAQMISLVKRVTVALSVVGAIGVLVFSIQISQVAFDTVGYASGVALVSLAVMFRVMTGGVGAVLQGLRRIRELALANIVGTFLGAAATIILVVAFNEKGIVPGLVASAFMGLVVTWFYERRVVVRKSRLGLAKSIRAAAPLFKLGFAFMVSAFLVMLTAFVVRVLIVRFEGLDAAGFYQAAWTLSGLYVGMILQAMSADFYPRLSGVTSDDALSNKYVNEQTEVSLLLAAPGIVLTLVFAPMLMVLFYSDQFLPATDVLRCLAVGMAMKVVSWPLGYVVIARGRQNLFMLLDAVWAVANVVLAYYLVGRLGYVGAGWAFFGAYSIQFFFSFWVANRVTSFCYSRTCARLLFVYFATIATAFIVLSTVGGLVGYLVSGGLLIATSVLAMRSIGKMVPMSVVPAPILVALRRIRLIPYES